MSKIVIGIHGIGNKPPRNILKEWWGQSIREGLSCPALSLQKRKKKLSKGEEKWQIEIGQ